jgi:prolycopene isomerase
MGRGYDAIILGSGIGGLTCGAFLAREGMRVLVLEKHIRIGGYADSFKRRGYRFEAAIHSVPMGPDGLVRHLLRLLDIEKNIDIIEQDEMFRVVTPELSYTLPSRRDEIVGALTDSFPHERHNIARLIEEAKRFHGAIAGPLFELETVFAPENRAFVSGFHNRSYRSFLEEIIQDDELRFILGSQWPYAGSSPGYGPTVFCFMMFLMHVLEGSHYCRGGFTTLADALASVITGRGGSVRTRSTVERLRVHDKRVTAVRTAAGEEYEAPLVVSNISPYLLHNRLIDESSRSRRYIRRLGNLRPSVSGVAVYLGMDPRIREVLPGPITFWFAHRDHERTFDNILDHRGGADEHLVFLSAADDEERPTVMLLTFREMAEERDWKAAKMRIAESMLARAEELYPGFRACIRVREVGSPSTFERYTANTTGAFYGFENTRAMYGEAKMPIETHLSNLYQTGHWGKPGGSVWNVMANGYTTAKTILR